MKKIIWVLSVVLLTGILGCEKQLDDEIALNADANGDFQGDVLKSAHSNNMAMAAMRSFRASLSGMNEVPANESHAKGQAVFTLSKDMDAISYKLIVTNIENVSMAHIHAAPAGSNGGVVAWLYPASPPPALISGTTNGLLAEGTLTADNLVGSLAGEDISDLLEMMKNSEVYVNVHTSQFPGGEVRGQISLNSARMH